MKRVTINDVAKKSGVSKTAVSFAFNNPAHLSKTTVKKILRISKELGYAPHPIARSMNTGRTGVLGLLLPQDIPIILENPFFNQFMKGIGHVCDNEGLSFMLAPPLRGSMLKAIDHAVADGFIVIGLEAKDPVVKILKQRGIPFVMVDSDPVEDIPCVMVDDYKNSRKAALHIIKHGHRRIAIVAFESGKECQWDKYTGTLRWRLKGYLDGLATIGLSLNSSEITILECENSIKGGKYVLSRIWKASLHPTAILAMSDIISIGIINAAREQGIHVPKDLSVVGYDDIPEAQRSNPPLTTVRQPIVEKGNYAAELLVKVIEGVSTSEHYTLPTELVIRESVASPSLD
jgi:alanine racemase